MGIECFIVIFYILLLKCSTVEAKCVANDDKMRRRMPGINTFDDACKLQQPVDIFMNAWGSCALDIKQSLFHNSKITEAPQLENEIRKQTFATPIERVQKFCANKDHVFIPVWNWERRVIFESITNTDSCSGGVVCDPPAGNYRKDRMTLKACIKSCARNRFKSSEKDEIFKCKSFSYVEGSCRLYNVDLCTNTDCLGECYFNADALSYARSDDLNSKELDYCVGVKDWYRDTDWSVAADKGAADFLACVEKPMHACAIDDKYDDGYYLFNFYKCGSSQEYEEYKGWEDIYFHVQVANDLKTTGRRFPGKRSDLCPITHQLMGDVRKIVRWSDRLFTPAPGGIKVFTDFTGTPLNGTPPTTLPTPASTTKVPSKVDVSFILMVVGAVSGFLGVIVTIGFTYYMCSSTRGVQKRLSQDYRYVATQRLAKEKELLRQTELMKKAKRQQKRKKYKNELRAEEKVSNEIIEEESDDEDTPTPPRDPPHEKGGSVSEFSTEKAESSKAVKESSPKPDEIIKKDRKQRIKKK